MSLDTQRIIFTQVKPGSTVYGVAVALDSTQPTVDQIELGQNASGVSAISSTSETDSGQGAELLFEGLTFNTQYSFFIVAKLNGLYSDIKKVNAYTMQSVTELRGALSFLSGEDVTVTGTDIDLINNQAIPGWMNFSPLGTKAILQATGGPNSKPTMRFSGLVDERYSAGTSRFPISTFTLYLFFKSDSGAVRQTLWTNDVTSNLFEVQVGRVANNLSIQYRNATPATVTDHIPLDASTSDNLVEIKFKSATSTTSEYIVKVNGVVKIRRTGLMYLNNNVATTDQYFGQLAGRTTAPNLFPLDGDLHFNFLLGLYQTNEEEQAVYNWVNSYYNKSYVREND
jgi:hypothetical protein